MVDNNNVHWSFLGEYSETMRSGKKVHTQSVFLSKSQKIIRGESLGQDWTRYWDEMREYS